MRKKTKQQNGKKKVCFAASSGGHLEELMMMGKLMDQYDSFILTEKTLYQMNFKGRKVYYLYQTNRKEMTCLPRMIVNTFSSIRIFVREKPDVVICTGVLSMIPMCLLVKLTRRKLIFVESFAKTNTPTLTGKLLYHFADQFYVQWESMLKIYPNAIYLGGLY